MSKFYFYENRVCERRGNYIHIEAFEYDCTHEEALESAERLRPLVEAGGDRFKNGLPVICTGTPDAILKGLRRMCG